jgi:hypothetical protein
MLDRLSFFTVLLRTRVVRMFSPPVFEVNERDGTGHSLLFSNAIA